ncbi:hypothetical protein [Aquimarina sp. I32.4]|uniref:hypothetical protein n=1 Tax=Aquimarina sp. I32.4 TaxID=2053903 RepID=UPI000CDE58FD|nr:hypothetical protein [Aquimarina sp. I32.4]
MIDKIIELPMFLEKNIIEGLFTGVILIIFVRLFFKEKIETIITLEIIRWTIITYCLITLITWLLILMFPISKNYVFLDRITGLYAWLYWLFFLLNTVIPLILLNRKVGKKIYIVFLLTLLMNIGWAFESFLILKSSSYMNYIENNYIGFFFNGRQIPILIKGFFVGLISLVIGNGIRKWKHLK